MSDNQTSKKPQRHCMVVHAYYPLAETRVQREAEALVADGVEVDIICLRLPSEPNFEMVRGINVYRLPAETETGDWSVAAQFFEYLRFFILVTVKLTRLHYQKRYDVIQVHNLPDFLVFCALWPKIRGTPIILDIHDVTPELFADRTGRSLDGWLGRLAIWQEQISCRFANHVITVTEPWRQTLINRGVPQEKSSVVMNMADAKLFNPAVRQRISGQKQAGTFHLIYHGVQSYRHGLDILFKAMAKIRSQIPELQLTLHGSGEYHYELVDLAAELGLTDCINFSHRYVPVSELPALVAEADVGVVPYRRDIFTDGILPTKLMEYISLGMPTIAARTPAIETYFDETMVQFFTPGDVDELANSLLTLYNDQKRMAQLVQGSLRFRERYDWAKLKAEYVALVKKLAQNRSTNNR